MNYKDYGKNTNKKAIVKCGYKPKSKVYCLFSNCNLFNRYCHNNCEMYNNLALCFYWYFNF